MLTLALKQLKIEGILFFFIGFVAAIATFTAPILILSKGINMPFFFEGGFGK